MSAMAGKAAARTMRPGAIVPLYLAVALVLGGASTPTSSWSFALQLISILCLAYGVATMPGPDGEPDFGSLHWSIFASLG